MQTIKREETVVSSGAGASALLTSILRPWRPSVLPVGLFFSCGLKANSFVILTGQRSAAYRTRNV